MDMHSPKYTLFLWLKQNNWHFCYGSVMWSPRNIHVPSINTPHSELIWTLSMERNVCISGAIMKFIVSVEMWVSADLCLLDLHYWGFNLLGIWGLIDLLIIIILFIDKNFMVEANSSSWLITRNRSLLRTFWLVLKNYLNFSLLRTKNSMSRGLFYSFLYFFQLSVWTESQCYLFWDVPQR